MAKTSLKQNKRLLWPDLIRIIAIYFVIVIHNSTLPATFTSQNFLLFTQNAITGTCVPLFVMISGALLLGKQENYKIFFTKRSLKVLIPWVFWTIIYMLWHIAIDHTDVSSLSKIKYFFQLTFLTQLWFLPMIFGLYLVTPMLRLFIKVAIKRDIAYALILWFIFLSVLPYYRDSQAFPLLAENGLVRQVLLYSGYFVLGYFLTLFKIPRLRLVSFMIFIGGIIWTMLGAAILLAKHSNNIPTIMFDFLSPSMIVTSIGAFLFVMSLEREKMFSKPKLRATIVSLGNAAFGIYLVHQLLMWSIGKEIPKEIFISNRFPVLLTLEKALLFFLLSYVVIVILKRIPLVKNMVP